MKQKLVDLPRSLPELETFTTQILKKFQIPDNLSYHRAIATMIMHLEPTADKAPLAYFGAALRKAQANEVAFERLQQIKELEKAASNDGQPV